MESLVLCWTKTTLPPEVFTDLQELRKLDISQMGLTRLPHLGNNRKIEHLSAEGNPISELADDLFGSSGELSAVCEVSLKDCGLRQIPAALFAALRNVSILNLSKNQLEELPAAMGLLQRLIHLKVRDNPLRKIDPSVLQIPTFRSVDLGIYSSKEVYEQVREVFPYKEYHLSDERIEELKRKTPNGASYCNEYHKHNPIEN